MQEAMPLDPALQPILDAMNSRPRPPAGLSTAELRAIVHAEMDGSFFAIAEPAPEVANIVDRRVAVDGGEITVRVYTPPGTGPFPAHLYLHGGGFWVGTLDQFDGVCRGIAVGAECIVASVDYRLAPEHRFPTAAEDSYAALLWVVEHAAELGIDVTRVSVGGASVGGNLAAVTALMARDRTGPRLVFQVLEIPVTDLTMSFPSITENGTGYMLTAEGIEQYTGYYLGETGDPKDPYASPVLADDLSGLPPALVVTAELDPLRDEGEAYGQRLLDAGVPTTVVRMDGHIHGSMGFTKLLPSAREHHARVLTALRKAYAQ